LEQAAGAEVAAGLGCLRLLVQSRDGIAAARAHDLGAMVLTTDEWSEEMARAVIQPRFLGAEDQHGWQGIWASVGGHAAHLRRIAELLHTESVAIAREGADADREKKKMERNRQLRPKRSPDAEEFGKIAEQQHDEDSYRFDARLEVSGVAERLLRRLPEAMEEEMGELESQAAAFARHPCLRELADGGAMGPGQSAAQLAGVVRQLCASSDGVAAPAGGIGALQDPVYIALLDVGLVVPRWPASSDPRLVLASKLARSVLLAWADTLCAELPLKQRLECNFWLWRLRGSNSESKASPRPAA